MALALSSPQNVAATPPSTTADSPAGRTTLGAADSSNDDWGVWWRPFGLYDYLSVGAVVGIYYAVEFGIDDPGEASWDSPLPVIDRPIRDWIVADTRAQRERADRYSDYGWYASLAYPILLSAVAPPVRGASFEMVWELEMMNLRSLAVASLVTRIPHKLIGRKRPNSVGCADDPDYDEQCGAAAQNQSFFGGHTSMSMTGAGLACAHHMHANLYGGGWADAVGCGGALAVATGVLYMRQRADRHWMSDNLVGASVGLAVGYGLPTVLNYHPFWKDNGMSDAARGADRESAYAVRWELLPLATTETAGVAVVGLF
jgi:hypothetical protein